MENLVKLEHYVPRAYLKAFSFQTEKPYQINCYDKIENTVRCISNSKIACENQYFADQVFEKIMSKMEGEISLALGHACSLADVSKISEVDRSWLALFISIELVRIKEHRAALIQSIEAITEFLEKNGIRPESGKLWQEYNEVKKDVNGAAVEVQKDVILDNMGTMANIIMNHKWAILKNTSSMPIWTSDNPVVMFNSMTMNSPGTVGLASEGIEIYLPLNPELLLYIVDWPAYQKNIPKEYLDDDMSTANDSNILFSNSQQVANAYRHIFSRDSNFDFAKRVISEHPELADRERRRIVY